MNACLPSNLCDHMFDPSVRDVVELVPVAVDGVHVDLP